MKLPSAIRDVLGNAMHMKEWCLALIKRSDIRPKNTPWHIKEFVLQLFHTFDLDLGSGSYIFLHFSMLDALIVLLSCA
jgi:hypothetical protein